MNNKYMKRYATSLAIMVMSRNLRHKIVLSVRRSFGLIFNLTEYVGVKQEEDMK
jgi:hypothetical protein